MLSHHGAPLAKDEQLASSSHPQDRTEPVSLAVPGTASFHHAPQRSSLTPVLAQPVSTWPSLAPTSVRKHSSLPPNHFSVHQTHLDVSHDPHNAHELVTHSQLCDDTPQSEIVVQSTAASLPASNTFQKQQPIPFRSNALVSNTTEQCTDPSTACGSDARISHLDNGYDANVSSPGAEAMVTEEYVQWCVTKFGMLVMERSEDEKMEAMWLACKFCALYGHYGRKSNQGKAVVIDMFERPFDKNRLDQHVSRVHKDVWEKYDSLTDSKKAGFFHGMTLPPLEDFMKRLLILKRRKRNQERSKRKSERMASMTEEERASFQRDKALNKAAKKGRRRGRNELNQGRKGNRGAMAAAQQRNNHSVAQLGFSKRESAT